MRKRNTIKKNAEVSERTTNKLNLGPQYRDYEVVFTTGDNIENACLVKIKHGYISKKLMRRINDLQSLFGFVPHDLDMAKQAVTAVWPADTTSPFPNLTESEKQALGHNNILMVTPGKVDQNKYIRVTEIHILCKSIGVNIRCFAGCSHCDRFSRKQGRDLARLRLMYVMTGGSEYYKRKYLNTFGKVPQMFSHCSTVKMDSTMFSREQRKKLYRYIMSDYIAQHANRLAKRKALS